MDTIEEILLGIEDKLHEEIYNGNWASKGDLVVKTRELVSDQFSGRFESIKYVIVDALTEYAIDVYEEFMAEKTTNDLSIRRIRRPTYREGKRVRIQLR